ncbi:hypothetical protein D3C72_2498890 [compost metagenome]
MGRHKIHEAKTQALHARVGCDFKSTVHRSRGFDEDMDRYRGGRGFLQRPLRGQYVVH